MEPTILMRCGALYSRKMDTSAMDRMVTVSGPIARTQPKRLRAGPGASCCDSCQCRWRDGRRGMVTLLVCGPIARTQPKRLRGQQLTPTRHAVTPYNADRQMQAEAWSSAVVVCGPVALTQPKCCTASAEADWRHQAQPEVPAAVHTPVLAPSMWALDGRLRLTQTPLHIMRTSASR